MSTLDHMNMLLADGASSTTVAWFALAGALGGVLVTGLVSLVTVTLNHRWQSQGTEQQRLQDHNTLVRHERRESYAAYWLAWNQFTHRLRRLSNEVLVGNIVNGRIISSAGALLTIILVGWLVPETKGRSLEEITELWTAGKSSVGS